MARIRTNWTPLYVEPLLEWGALAHPPGPTVLAAAPPDDGPTL